MGLFDSFRDLLGNEEGADADEPADPGADGGSEKGATTPGKADGRSGDSDRGDASGAAAAAEPTATAPDVPAPTTGEDDGPPPRAAAEALAGNWSAYDLDFSVASLARLDEFLARELSPDRYGTYSFRLAAYLGEVFVRNHGWEWAETDAAGWVVRVPGDPEPVDVGALVSECLWEDATFASVHESVVDGRGPAADEGTADGVTVAGRYRARAEAFAAEWPGYDLDFSVESLVRLDALVDDQYDPAESSDQRPADGPTAAFGGYFAEVVRRHHDAEWRDGDDGATLVVEGEGGTADLAPESVAADCLSGVTSFLDAYARVAADLELTTPADEA